MAWHAIKPEEDESEIPEYRKIAFRGYRYVRHL